MPKVAMIGAGSLIFCSALTTDILATEALKDSEICLMNRTKPKLDRMEAYIKRVVEENNLPATVTATLDRREALQDADYVIVMIQVGGVDAFGHDYKIPLKYGVDQCIGDSLGPGGVFRALRTIPVLIEIARDMEALCPNAIMLNYANPMAACCFALGKASNVEYIGLCHGVQTTLDLIGGYVDVPKEEIDFLCAGVNHMGWFLSLKDKRDGRDLYPILRENFEKPGYYVNEKVRGEVMRHFGYFMTESTGHLSEYIPWFRSHKRALELYCDEPDFGGASGAYYKYSMMIADKYTDGNVRNDGYITNLPQGCCVEVPVYVDSRGLHPMGVGDLPPQCAALNQSNITVQTLAVESALTGDPESAMQAIAMDPLTSAVCTLNEIREMTAEMFEAEKEWLPQYEGKTLRKTPPIVIGPDVERAEVPLDPALAIANRFGELAEQELADE